MHCCSVNRRSLAGYADFSRKGAMADGQTLISNCTAAHPPTKVSRIQASGLGRKPKAATSIISASRSLAVANNRRGMVVFIYSSTATVAAPLTS
jgi:hypothetical protein